MELCIYLTISLFWNYSFLYVRLVNIDKTIPLFIKQNFIFVFKHANKREIVW